MIDPRPVPASEEAVTECELEAGPETVWRALTEPHLVADWLGAVTPGPDGFALDAPGAGRADGAVVEGAVVEAEPPHRLAWAWREAGGPDTLVTFELTPAGEGRTRLRIVHAAAARRGTTLMTAAPHPRRRAPRSVTRAAPTTARLLRAA